MIQERSSGTMNFTKNKCTVIHYSKAKLLNEFHWDNQDTLACVKRPSHGELKLANSSWCVWTAQKQSVNMLANCWRQIELVFILANFFTTFFVLVDLFVTGERLANVLLTVDQSKHWLYSRDLSTWHFTKWRTQFKMNMVPLLNLSKRCTTVQLCGTFHL